MVSTKITTKYKPSINHHPDNPSLKSTKIKQAKTKAEPVSFCNNVKSIGNKMIPKQISWLRLPSNLTSKVPRNLASASAVAYLANSDGCNLKAPILNQA